MFLKAVSLFAVMVLLGLGIQMALHEPGEVVMHWRDYEIVFSTAFLFISVAVGLAVMFLSGYLWAWLIALPHALRQWRFRKNERAGLDALYQAFEALASGDAPLAVTKAKKAGRILEDDRVPLLLKAEAYHQRGRDDLARETYVLLAESDKTAFSGLKGLLSQAVRDKDWQMALALGEACIAEKPNSPWVCATIFDVYLRAGAFKKAEKLLPKLRKLSALPEQDIESYDVALLLYEYRTDPTLFKTLLKKLKKQPGCKPLAFTVVSRYLEEKRYKDAEKVLAHLWVEAPSAPIFKLWVQSVKRAFRSPHLSKRAQKVLARTEPSAQRAWAEGYVQLEEDRVLEARTALHKGITQHPFKEMYELLAHAERRLNPSSAEASHWLEQAIHVDFMPDGTTTLSENIRRWQNVFLMGDLYPSAQSISKTLKKAAADKDKRPLANQEVKVSGDAA